MEPIHLFDLAAQQSRYTARDVEPFEAVVRKTTLSLAATAPNHISSTPAEALTARPRKSDSWSTVHSGNSVSLEQEMLKAGEISRNHAFTTNIVRSFHRMMMTAIKG